MVFSAKSYIGELRLTLTSVKRFLALKTF